MTNYTLAELQAMPSDDLSALAAELRGWKFSAAGILEDGSGQEVRQKNCVVFKLGTASESYPYFWSLATDRNQSGELLQWLTRRYWTVDVGFGLGNAAIVAMVDDGELDKTIKIPGNDARAETVAFCAAMLAIKGRLR